MTRAIDALVLAGRRDRVDALAAAHGVSHRGLLPVGEIPMLRRVIETLRSTAGVERIAVSLDDPAVLEKVDELVRLKHAGALELHPSRGSPSRSVLDFLDRKAEGGRVLVTTCDHPLLTPSMVEHFCAAAGDCEADAVVGVVHESLVRRAYPRTRRTVIRLGPDRICGANLFLFRTPAGRKVAEFWTRAEQFRKQPWKLARAFGPGALLRYALGTLDLNRALEVAAGAIGARVVAVPLPFAECAIDVDSADDLALANRIIAAREGTDYSESVDSLSSLKPRSSGS